MHAKARRRNYSQRTLKVLFARSGDQCAVKNCQNPIIQPKGENDESVLGQICHIYARNPTGPRGDGGLRDDQINDESNLILLCPNHHQIIDNDPKRYTAEVLKKMKNDHVTEVRRRIIQPEKLPKTTYASFPTAIIDDAINHALDTIRKCQFYPEFDVTNHYTSLAARIIDGEFCGGSDEVRALGLSWCIRYAAIHATEPNTADHYLQEARRLSHGLSITIAESYLLSRSQSAIDLLKPLREDRSPPTVSALFYLLKVRCGVDKALEWFADSGLIPSDFDSVGKVVLLKSYLDVEDWNATLSTLDYIDEADLDSMPLLNHLVGLTHLLLAVPDELKNFVVLSVPINAGTFPLAADEGSTMSLQRAADYFESAASSAKVLNCSNSSRVSIQYAVWMRLLNPTTREEMRREIKKRFENDDVPLHLVNLALEFDVEIPGNDVEKQLEQTIALTGLVSFEATTARFALATIRESPEEFADYIDRHFKTLSTQIQPKFLRINQISVLASHGHKRRAKECLDTLSASDIEISKSEQLYLTSLIKDEKLGDLIEQSLEQFQRSDGIGDLRFAVDVLQTHRRWEDLCFYSKLLFERTRSIGDAETVAQALRNCNKSIQLRDFLDAHSFIVGKSRHLKLISCWSLLDHGQLRAARNEFLELERRDDDPNYRELEVMTSILTGHWESLLPFVENQLKFATERDPYELLRAASLAQDLGSPCTKELVIAAAASGEDDPEILAGAFELATRGGWEDDHRPGEWIDAARRLSDSDGPILALDWDGLVSQVPIWRRQRTHIKDLVERAEVPMIAGAESLRQSLSDLVLVPAFSNLDETELRRMMPIPIYSGLGTPKIFALTSTIGFDLTSLLVLEFLGILSVTFSSIDSIVLPSGILEVLLWERSSSRFHQPSRVEHGRHLQSLVLANRLIVLVPSSTPDGDLASEVGDELAILLAEANRIETCKQGERVVVRSAPVHRVWHKDRSVVDLVPHSKVLVNCHAVVEKLKDRGELTEEEYNKAVSYLLTQEDPWPNQPEILDGAELFLDSLSVSYFLYLGLMTKICSAGFRVFITGNLMSQFNALITRDTMLSRVRLSVDNIRREIVTGIESGKIRISPNITHNAWNDESKALQMIESLYVMAKNCDVMICDDRFFNQKERFSANGKNTPILSTISIIESLLAASAINTTGKHVSLTRLRRSGFLLVPVGLDEMVSYLSRMRFVSGKSGEPAELKAIRLSLRLARVSTAFDPEKDFRWLDGSTETMIRSIRAEWTAGGRASDLRCRSNWVSEQIDMRPWAHKLDRTRALEVAHLNYLGLIPALFTIPPRLAEDLVSQYWEWIEETILSEVRLKSTHGYRALVQQHRTQIDSIVEGQIDILGEQFGGGPELKNEIAQVALEYSPPLIRRSLLADKEYLAEYGSSVFQVMLFRNGRVGLRRDQLFNAIRKVLLNAETVELADVGGNTWSVHLRGESNEGPICYISSGDDEIRLPNLFSLSPDRDSRMSFFRHSADQMRLPTEVQNNWRERLETRALEDFEVMDLLDEFKDSVVYIANIIGIEFGKNKIDFDALVPDSNRYYQRLVGAYKGESNIREYASGSGKTFLSDVTKRKTKESLMLALLVSAHSELTKQIPLGAFDPAVVHEAFSDIAEKGDSLSQLGALEAGFRIAHRKPELERVLEELIIGLRDDRGQDERIGYSLQASLFVLTDSEFSRRRILTEFPPFYRRLAALSHSSILYRSIVQSSVDIAAFCSHIHANVSPRFQFQSLVDMRSEPRWEPTFCAPIYFRSEFLSRVYSTAINDRDSIIGTRLESSLFGNQSDSIQSQLEFPAWYFAGPLEGVLGSTGDLADDIVSIIQQQMDSAVVAPKSFVALINGAFLGSVELAQAELASDVLLRGRYRFVGVEDKGQLMSVLYGLARVSAYARSSSLALALRIVSRNYRNDREFGLSIEEELRIILMAASSFEDLDGWCKYVGEWMMEASALDLEGSELREYLYRSLEMLCDMVPELWLWCGSAHGALSGEYESRWT